MTTAEQTSNAQPETGEATHGVTLTDAAAAKAKALLEQEGRDDMHLRIAVQPGGCAGLKYQLFFDERTLDGDLFRDFGGIQVAVDRMSAPYVTNAVIDFVDSIEKQGFTIDNPNATGSCACGDSFH
jgi:iron-sulfur cluster assembly accessory protein